MILLFVEVLFLLCGGVSAAWACLSPSRPWCSWCLRLSCCTSCGRSWSEATHYDEDTRCEQHQDERRRLRG